MAKIFDVIIIGLGGVGSAAACHLADRGKRVLGLERFTPAHDRGSSHGDSRIIRQAYHENPGYVPLVLRAYELWEKLERDTSTNLLTITGGLFLGAKESSVVQGSLRSARQHNLAHDLLDAKEISRRFPVLHPQTTDYAVYEKKAGFLRPEAAVKAHLHLAVKHSAMLHFEEPVSTWEVTASGAVCVTTPKAVYEAEHLVLAPGAWAADLLKLPSVSLRVRRHVMAWFDPIEKTAYFTPDRFPVYIWQTPGDVIFYGFPAIDAQGGVKAAIHSGGDICMPETIDRNIREDDISAIRRQLAAYIPALQGRLLHATTCMYTLTDDEHFVVSQHPEHSQAVIACGFSGHGFKFTSVLGEVLADLVTEGRTKYPIDFLSPARFFI